MSLSENFEHDTPASRNSQCGMGALACDAYHHHYHYQSSTQYLWLAYSSFALGLADEAMAALGRALFQDHFNEEALELKRMQGKNMPSQRYDKHPLRDETFCAAVGLPGGPASTLHDEAVAFWREKHFVEARTRFMEALTVDPMHSNSYLGAAKCNFMLGDYATARSQLKEAVRLSHIGHDAYHKTASAEHVKRGKAFLQEGKRELAINAFTKALDLHQGNEEASLQREAAGRLDTD